MIAEARTVTIIMSAPTAAKLEWRNSIMTVMDAPAPSSGRIRSAAAPAPSAPSPRVGGFSREISGSGCSAGVVLAGRWTIRVLIGYLPAGIMIAAASSPRTTCVFSAANRR